MQCKASKVVLKEDCKTIECARFCPVDYSTKNVNRSDGQACQHSEPHHLKLLVPEVGHLICKAAAHLLK